MWTRLDRFLILGSEGGSYYASEKALTVENAQNVIACAKADGPEAVRRIVSVSVEGRAPKNDAAIFALAIVAAFGDKEGKAAAYEAVSQVCRIGTHLFQFAEASNALRGWGRGLRRAIGEWYTGKRPQDLAYQLTKYQQRDGWSHRDLLRLSHPKAAPESDTNALLHWAVKGWPAVGDEPHPNPALAPVWAMERAKVVQSEQEVVRLIRDYRLPRECVPTQWLNSVAVWEALLEEMPVTALVRNLGKMTSIKLLAPMSYASGKAIEKLGDEEALRKARLHPVSLLKALKVYQQGKGDKGKLTWTPDGRIVGALDSAFYTAFKAVKPTNKRWLLAVDVSGSMGSHMCGGIENMDCRTGAAAMALVTANVEREHLVVGFTNSGWTGGYRSQYHAHNYVNGITPLDISPKRRLDDVVKYMSGLQFGGTDCALPMLYAAEHDLKVDAFVVYTDNETWAGNVHPTQALKQYREKTGIPAKLIVVGMMGNAFTIADPNDAGQMDVVGFDTDAPSVMAEFVGHA